VALKWVIFAIIIYFFVLPLIPGFGKAFSELAKVRPSLLVLGLGLELAALFAYSLLTHAALGDSRHSISIWRLFRIQLSTKSVSNVLPAGSAASSALGFKLLTSSGVPGPDAGFALATAGLGSAVVLNLILWIGLIASIPGQGVNAAYGSAALVGVILMLVATGLVVGLIDGQGRAERSIKWIATKLRMNPDNAADVLRQLGFRLQGLAREPGLKERVFVWALLNWYGGCANHSWWARHCRGYLYSNTRWFWFDAKRCDSWCIELSHCAILDAAYCRCNCVLKFACWAMGHRSQ
jgi:uncharacterized membrane protein YbhN (UPF0104 family)